MAEYIKKIFTCEMIPPKLRVLASSSLIPKIRMLSIKSHIFLDQALRCFVRAHKTVPSFSGLRMAW